MLIVNSKEMWVHGRYIWQVFLGRFWEWGFGMINLLSNFAPNFSNYTMKKSLQMLIVFAFLGLSANAQPWAAAGATWYYTVHNTTIPYPVDGYDKYEKIGDTLVGGKLCDNILESFVAYDWQLSQWDSSHTNNFTYQSHDTVFYWVNNKFWIYAIESAQVGDTWNFAVDTFFCHDSSYFHVDSLGQRIVGTDTLPVWYLTPHNYVGSVNQIPINYTKKIGFNNTMFHYSICITDYYQWGPLRCYHDSSGFSYNSGIVLQCDSTVGIENINVSNNFPSVFPNPASTLLNIHQSIPSPNQQFIITDLLGTEVYKEMLPSIDNLKAGIYFYEVRSNTDIARGKFVKEL
jgi:hypothetical protein